MNTLFNPVVDGAFSITGYIVCTVVAMLLGGIVALSLSVKGRLSKNFALSLVLLPPIVETVLILVNGNLGTGIAVMGAFSLVRFRSLPGSSREIVGIFMSMALGVAAALGYLGVAVIFTAIVCVVVVLFALINVPQGKRGRLELRITVPENLNYVHCFDEVFEKYTKYHKLTKAKTASLGSLYKLTYEIELKSAEAEKNFIDEIRIRNGNLEVSLGELVRTEEF